MRRKSCVGGRLAGAGDVRRLTGEGQAAAPLWHKSGSRADSCRSRHTQRAELLGGAGLGLNGAEPFETAACAPVSAASAAFSRSERLGAPRKRPLPRVGPGPAFLAPTGRSTPWPPALPAPGVPAWRVCRRLWGPRVGAGVAAFTTGSRATPLLPTARARARRMEPWQGAPPPSGALQTAEQSAP